MEDVVDVSIVIPVHNAAPFLDEALAGVEAQTYPGNRLELLVVDDGSTDASRGIAERWVKRLQHHRGMRAQVIASPHGAARGIGWATNTAVRQCTGTYLCLMDADDISEPARIALQVERIRELETAGGAPMVIVGANFTRIPEDATARYTTWLNRLSDTELMTQRFIECTLIKPTWLLRRATFEALGGFDEGGRGVPEDMIFFYRHLDVGGRLAKVSSPPLVRYRHVAQGASSTVHELTLFRERLAALERQVLVHWPSFVIWNAGKLGRRLYLALSPENQRKVRAFCDVDARKIALGQYFSPGRTTSPVPIVHYTNASPPFILCVKLDLTRGQFEDNLASLQLREGIDYIHFC